MKGLVKSLLLAGLATFSINSAAQAQSFPLCPGMGAIGPFSSQMAIPLPATPGSTIVINWDIVAGNFINKVSANGPDFLGEQSSTQIIVPGQSASKTISTVVYGLAPTSGNPSVPLILLPFQIITNITRVNGLHAILVSVLGSGVSYSCVAAEAGVIPNTTGPQVIVGAGVPISGFNVSSFLPQTFSNPITIEYSLFFAVMASVGGVDDFFAAMQATIASLTIEKNAAVANVASCQNSLNVQVNSSASTETRLKAALSAMGNLASRGVAVTRKNSEARKAFNRMRRIIKGAGIN